MAESRFYWIKLKLNMLTSKTVDFLMSQKDGANYVILYQMLCLLTINSNGELADYIGEVIIPFDEAKIQRDTKYFNIDTIRVALGLYQKLGLVYVQENGILKIADFENLIGSESGSAKRVREYRERQRLESNSQALQCNKNVTQIVTQENRYKSIDNRDIDINNNSSNYIYTPTTTNNEAENPIESSNPEEKDLSIKLQIETIFKTWNEMEKTIHHNELNVARKFAIKKALSKFKGPDIIQAIKNYDFVLRSSWYFNYRWSLEDFLNRKNGISTFTDEGSNWNTFQEEVKKNPLLLPKDDLKQPPVKESSEAPQEFKEFLKKL